MVLKTISPPTASRKDSTAALLDVINDGGTRKPNRAARASCSPFHCDALIADG